MNKLKRVFKLLGSFINLLSSAAGIVAALAVLVMSLLIVVDITLRSLFNTSTQLAVEISSYLMVTLTLLGLSYTLKTGGHIRIDVVTSRLRQRMQVSLSIVVSALAMVYVIALTVWSYGMVLDSYRLHTTSITFLRTPLYIPQALIPVGLFLLALLLMIDVIEKIRLLEAKKDNQMGKKQGSL